MTNNHSSFVYERLPELTAGRARLRELRNQKDQFSEAHQKLMQDVVTADEKMQLLENRLSIGQATNSEVQMARQDLLKAKAELDRYQLAPAIDKAIQDMNSRIEELTAKEAAMNWKRLAPLYKDAVQNLNQAFEAVRVANDKVMELQECGGVLLLGSHLSWSELTNNQLSKLSEWRRYAKSKGFLSD